jgi:hypothetical protein
MKLVAATDGTKIGRDQACNRRNAREIEQA